MTRRQSRCAATSSPRTPCGQHGLESRCRRRDLRADTTEEMIERANRAANSGPLLLPSRERRGTSGTPCRPPGPWARSRGRAADIRSRDHDPGPARTPAGDSCARERSCRLALDTFSDEPSPDPRAGRWGRGRRVRRPARSRGPGRGWGGAARRTGVPGGAATDAGTQQAAPARAPTSPWQDSWLNPAGLPGSPYSGTGSRPAMPTPVAPPPIFCRARGSVHCLAPAHRPPEPIAEPETPEAVGDPARDTGTIGDPVPAPGAAVQFAGPGPLPGRHLTPGRPSGALRTRGTIRGRVNSRNGPDFEEFASAGDP